MTLTEAAEDLRTLYEALGDNAERFTCSEAEAVQRLLNWAEPGLGDQFLALHAEGDETGDKHYEGN